MICMFACSYVFRIKLDQILTISLFIHEDIVLTVIMLAVIMLSIVMLAVIMLNVVRLNVVAPKILGVNLFK
jgi:hypothetical protein